MWAMAWRVWCSLVRRRQGGRMMRSGIEVWRIKDGGGGSGGRWIEGQRGRRQATEAVGPRSASGGSDS